MWLPCLFAICVSRLIGWNRVVTFLYFLFFSLFFGVVFFGFCCSTPPGHTSREAIPAAYTRQPSTSLDRPSTPVGVGRPLNLVPSATVTCVRSADMFAITDAHLPASRSVLACRTRAEPPWVGGSGGRLVRFAAGEEAGGGSGGRQWAGEKSAWAARLFPGGRGSVGAGALLTWSPPRRPVLGLGRRRMNRPDGTVASPSTR